MRDVKSPWSPTWHHFDHVSWSLGLISKTSLTQNHETMALRNLTIIDLLYLI